MVVCVEGGWTTRPAQTPPKFSAWEKIRFLAYRFLTGRQSTKYYDRFMESNDSRNRILVAKDRRYTPSVEQFMASLNDTASVAEAFHAHPGFPFSLERLIEMYLTKEIRNGENLIARTIMDDKAWNEGKVRTEHIKSVMHLVRSEFDIRMSIAHCIEKRFHENFDIHALFDSILENRQSRLLTAIADRKDFHLSEEQFERYRNLVREWGTDIGNTPWGPGESTLSFIVAEEARLLSEKHKRPVVDRSSL